MNEVKPKPFFTLELRCACGSSLFVELPDGGKNDYHGNELPKAIVQLGATWTAAHAAHHQEPKK